MRKTLSTKTGFTVIELLVVISILGAMSAIVMINFKGARGTARDTRRKSDLKQYQTALEVYANNKGNYPISGPTNAISLCVASILNISCIDDPNSGDHYGYSSPTGADYVLWATLERPPDSTKPFFVTCSNGNVGESGTSNSAGNCPL